MRRWFVALALMVTAMLAMDTASAQTTGAADTIRDVIRFGDHGAYERMVLDLGYEELPADLAPNYWWSYNGGGTILRLNLPTISSTLTTDGFGLGKGISHYYVVRGLNGERISTEVHLTDAAGPATVFYLNYPARIVIDVPTGGQNFRPVPAFGDSVVVKQPRAGYAVGPGIFTITGYGRPFEAVGTWAFWTPRAPLPARGPTTPATGRRPGAGSP
ncbi:MAG: hypothetical protein M3157_04825 [Actinomycetota bacterium]|nr:hypothetical protein [Actinomycetota bacterium]